MTSSTSTNTNVKKAIKIAEIQADSQAIGDNNNP